MKILIWDWDGTLVNTIPYKYEHIWKDVFVDEEEKQKIVIDFIRSPEGRGINRYGLIKHALLHTDRPDLKTVSDEELEADADIQKYAKRYKDNSEKHAVDVGLFSGTMEVLEGLFSDGYSMYIVSGGGTNEDMTRMAEDIGILKYFKGAYGFGAGGFTSFSKIENFKTISSKEGVDDASQYVVIGDSVSDYRFAENIGAGFIGFVRPWNRWENHQDKCVLIKDIGDIKLKLNEL